MPAFQNRRYNSGHGVNTSDWLFAKWQALNTSMRRNVRVTQVAHTGFNQNSVSFETWGSGNSNDTTATFGDQAVHALKFTQLALTYAVELALSRACADDTLGDEVAVQPTVVRGGPRPGLGCRPKPRSHCAGAGRTPAASPACSARRTP